MGSEDPPDLIQLALCLVAEARGHRRRYAQAPSVIGGIGTEGERRPLRRGEPGERSLRDERTRIVAHLDRRITQSVQRRAGRIGAHAQRHAPLDMAGGELKLLHDHVSGQDVGSRRDNILFLQVLAVPRLRRTVVHHQRLANCGSRAGNGRQAESEHEGTGSDHRCEKPLHHIASYFLTSTPSTPTARPLDADHTLSNPSPADKLACKA